MKRACVVGVQMNDRVRLQQATENIGENRVHFLAYRLAQPMKFTYDEAKARKPIRRHGPQTLPFAPFDIELKNRVSLKVSWIQR